MVAACGKGNEYVEPPPPKVTIAEPLQQEVIDYLEFTGTTHAFERVEVRARVVGFLQSMHFIPGTWIDEGDPLFVIDPREYQAKLTGAKAELQSAEAQLTRAKIEFARYERLFAEKAAAETDVVKWRGERDIARAAVYRARAALERAQLDLSYTNVTAPITGRVSRNLVDPGNLVGEGEATLLTTVTRYDPMHVYFNLNERDYLKVMNMYREQVKEKGIDPGTESAIEAEIPLFLGLANEEGYPHQGTADFAESGLDTGTGTLQLRGLFPNPDKPPVLVPGLFARIRMPIAKRSDALLVTERAIGGDQSGSYLMAVNSENVVEKRLIRTGQLVDGLIVIKEGLRPGEWVVVKGLQRARPGAKVDPERTEMSSLKASAIKAALQAKRDKAVPAEGKQAPAESTHKDKAGSARESAEDAATHAGPAEESSPQPAKQAGKP
jgi:RND family efflux transporter MFP subunit